MPARLVGTAWTRDRRAPAAWKLVAGGGAGACGVPLFLRLRGEPCALSPASSLCASLWGSARRSMRGKAGSRLGVTSRGDRLGQRSSEARLGPALGPRPPSHPAGKMGPKEKSSVPEGRSYPENLPLIFKERVQGELLYVQKKTIKTLESQER